MAKTDPLDPNVPAGSEDPKLGDNRIRELARAVAELLGVDHYMGTDGGAGTGYNEDAAGEHAIVTLRANSDPTVEANKGYFYAKDVGGKAELFYKDEDANVIQLTTAGAIKKSVIEGSAFVPAGATIPFAGSSAPTGWFLCDGTAISRTTYADLFAVCGTTYGAGDGSTTFNLPDLVGYFVRGLDLGGSVDPDARSAGSVQQDGIKKHYHNMTRATYGDGNESANVQRGDAAEQDITNVYRTTGPYDVGDDSYIGLTETRPKNVALNHIIKT